MNSDLLFLASLIVASLLGVPPCCVGKPRQNLGYAYVFRPRRLRSGSRLASRKNSGVIFSQILSCQTIVVGLQIAIFDSKTNGNLHTKQGEQIMDLFRELHQSGVTIIQVTHSEKNAAYGTRIIDLLDGNVQNDRQLNDVSNKVEI